MKEKDFCKQCDKKHSCRDVYEKIGKSKSPPVTMQLIKAFVLPVLLFILTFVSLESLITKLTNNSKLQIVLQIVIAGCITTLLIMFSKLLKTLFRK